MLKNKNINSSISGSKQVNKALTSSSLLKLIVDLSEILNKSFTKLFSTLSQVAIKHSSQILLSSLHKSNHLLPEINNLFNLDKKLSQVAFTYSSQILLPSSSQNNRMLPEINNLFNLDKKLSQVAFTYSSQILLPSSSQNNRTLPEIKYRRY